MTTRAILTALPATAAPAVAFRLDALRPFADAALLRAMFALPETWQDGADTHVVLTPAGPLLVDGQGVVRVAARPTEPLAPVRGPSLATRFAASLALLPEEDGDCLGVGQLPGQPPVVLHVRIDGVVGHASAWFGAAPSGERLDLLRSVGVEWVDTHEVGGGAVVVRFRNRLDRHLTAGILAGFRRTDHCNMFFLQQGRPDGAIEQGLVSAAADRIRYAADKAMSRLRALAERSVHTPLALRCLPPPPAVEEPYGDLVPLGFLLAACPHEPLRSVVAAHGRDGLWSYHRGGLATAMDTGFVALGIADGRTVHALDAFEGPDGGSYAQRWADTPTPGAMLRTPANAHWCQEDFVTTCLVEAVRREHGQPARAGVLAWLDRRYANRHSVFVANPFLVDWALARAAVGPDADANADGPAAELARRLRTDLLAAQNPDGTFGRFDRGLSTALAALAVARLGVRGKPLLMAQLALADLIDAEGAAPTATPFFSALLEPPASLQDRSATASEPEPGRGYSVTYYRDVHAIISTALTALALDESHDVIDGGIRLGCRAHRPDSPHDPPGGDSARDSSGGGHEAATISDYVTWVLDAAGRAAILTPGCACSGRSESPEDARAV